MDFGERYPRLARLARRPGLWLGVMTALYIGVSLYLSVLRLLEFSTANWDLGVFQQALWSTAHGGVFYEAGDSEIGGFNSYLEVHPSLILYLLVPLYAAFPAPETILVLQSIVVGLAAVPIYLLGREVIGRPNPALAIAGLYLVCGPLLAANLFDYHVESFFPLELSLLVLLWVRGRYGWGLAVAALTLVTLEVAPFLVAAIAAFFLLPAFYPLVRSLAARLRGGLASARTRVGFSWATLMQPQYRWTLILLGIAVVAYPLLRYFEWDIVPMLVVRDGISAYAPGYVTPPATGIPLVTSFTRSIDHKLGFWLWLLGFFAFLPLFSPRALLILSPWFAFTVASPQIDWTSFGFHYAFIPLAILPITAIYGFVNFEREIAPGLRAWWARRHHARAPPATDTRVGRWTRPAITGGRSLRHRAVAPVIVAIVVANLYFSPANPLNQTLSSPLSGYNVEYIGPPGFSSVEHLASFVPPGAYLLASSDLFPLVADSAQAYAISWTATVPANLPFSPSNPPTWVFLAENQFGAVPSWIPPLATSSAYGLRGVAWTTPVGPVFLWERGYVGPTLVLGTLDYRPVRQTNGSLAPTAVGRAVSLAGAPFGPAVESQGNLVLPFFTSAPISLLAGDWQLTVVAEQERGPRSVPPGAAPAFVVNVTAFGESSWSNASFAGSLLPFGAWTSLETRLTLTEPAVGLRVSGVAPVAGANVAIDAVEFQYLGPVA